MYIAIKLETFDGIYESLEEFARCNFHITVDKGRVYIKTPEPSGFADKSISEAPTSYDTSIYSVEQIYREFSNSNFFKSYAKARFWELYLVKEKVI